MLFLSIYFLHNVVGEYFVTLGIELIAVDASQYHFKEIQRLLNVVVVAFGEKWLDDRYQHSFPVVFDVDLNVLAECERVDVGGLLFWLQFHFVNI